MSYTLTGGKFQAFTNAGALASGYSLYTYVSGTTTPQATYTDYTLGQANANPVVLNARGEASIWIGSAVYTFVLKDTSGTTIWTVDGVKDTGTAASDTLRADLAATTGAALVGLPYGTLAAKLGRMKTLPDDFNAPTDGTTDATSAVLAALNSGAYVDGCGLTYKITAPMVVNTGVAPKLFNCTLDASTMTASAAATFVITVSGSQGSAVDLSSDAALGAQSVTVANGSTFANDGWVWLASRTIWNNSDSTYVEFLTRVASKSGTTLTLHEQTRYALSTVTGTKPTASPVTLLEGVVFENIKIIGERMAAPGTSGNYLSGGIYLDKCLSPVVRGVHTSCMNYAGVVFYRCVGPLREGGSSVDARANGYSYGTGVFGGTLGARIVGSYGYDLRHGVTVGDNDGISYKTTVDGCTFESCRDAGIDTHAAGDYFTAQNNFISISTYATGSGSYVGDGLTVQAPNCVVSGNTVIGAARHGIFAQMLTSFGGSIVVTGNTVNMNNSAASSIAINVTNQSAGAATLNGVTISGNTLLGAGTYGVYVYANTGDIQGVNISDNNASQFVASSNAVRLYVADNRTFNRIAIDGGSYYTTGTRVIYASVEPDNDGAGANVAGVMTNLSVSDVNLMGGTYAVSALGVGNVSVADLHNWTSTNALETTGSTGVKRDGAYFGSTTYNPPSLVDGAGVTTSLTVTGALLGQKAEASFDVDLAGITMTAWVNATNTVAVRFQNESGGTVDLASGTLRAWAKPILE